MARTRKESNPVIDNTLHLFHTHYTVSFLFIFKFDWFELNQESQKLIVCPQLDHSTYVPDLIDLTKDEEARDYWLKCFERTIETVILDLTILTFGEL